MKHGRRRTRSCKAFATEFDKPLIELNAEPDRADRSGGPDSHAEEHVHDHHHAQEGARKTPETETGRTRARRSYARCSPTSTRAARTAVRDYALKLDGWTGPIVVSTGRDRPAAPATFPQAVKDDIDFAIAQVRRFAEAQRALDRAISRSSSCPG